MFLQGCGLQSPAHWGTLLAAAVGLSCIYVAVDWDKLCLKLLPAYPLQLLVVQQLLMPAGGQHP
jgi:hypothetical protein